MADCDDALAMFRIANGDTLLETSIAERFAQVATLSELVKLVVEKGDDLTATILSMDYDVPSRQLVDALRTRGFFDSIEDILSDRHIDFIRSKIQQKNALSPTD